MNIKKTVKKMTAILTGATMLGATVMGAMAADLGDYPAPLITNGVWNGKVVVGAAAAATDIAGAASLGANLQTYSRVPVSVGGGVVTVEGGELVEQALNGVFDFSLDYRHLEGFADDEFTIGSKTIRYREHFDAETGSLKVVTSSIEMDEDMGSEPYLTMNSADALVYAVRFRNAELLEADFGTTTNPHTAQFDLLGTTVTITGIDETEEEVTLEASTTRVMEVGDSVEVDGRTVSIQRVGSSSALVTVNGQALPVTVGQTQNFNQAANFKVRLDSVFYEEGASDNLAVLELGDSLSTTISTNDPATLFGEIDDTREASWLWELEFNGATGGLSGIGVKSNQVRTEVEVTRSRDRPALAVGDELMLPNNYVGIEFVGLSENSYNELTIDIDNDMNFIDEDDYAATGAALEFHIEGGDFFEVDTHTMQTLYALFLADNTIEFWYFDGNEEVLADSYAAVDVGNAEFTLNIDGDDIVINVGTAGEITFNVDGLTVEYDMVAEHFGSDDSSVPTDLLANGEELGTRDFDILTTYGIVIENPDSQFDSSSGRFVMSIPQNEQEAQVLVKSMGTQQQNPTTGGAYQIVPIPGADVGVLDNEVMNMIGTVPMLVVGGPNANTVAANLLGVEQFSEEITEMFQPNRAMIRLFEDRNAILVAGYEGKDTRAASLALADFENNKEDFAGNMEVEIIVSGTTVDSIVGVNNN